jgi:hypothetical protein
MYRMGEGVGRQVFKCFTEEQEMKRGRDQAGAANYSRAQPFGPLCVS